jgi:heme A synthase
MAADESHEQGRQNPEAERAEDPTRNEPRPFLWWCVWIPVIIVVILWIGGWWFGNYGGPWGPKPPFVQPSIGEPARAMLDSYGAPRPVVNASVRTTFLRKS